MFLHHFDNLSTMRSTMLNINKMVMNGFQALRF